MYLLVGNSGFIGSNLAAQYNFDMCCNSANIEMAFGSNPDLCVYSGVRAEMFLANSNPQADMDIIKNAINNIKKINPKKIVLISTVAVYDKVMEVDEDTIIDENQLAAYGKNRRYLEKWIEDNIKDYHIVRLPAVYGNNLKKNFIYDMITISPTLLTKEKFEELLLMDDFIKDYYELQDNGFWKCLNIKAVKSYFEKNSFSALNFTDSRSIYQFYNLKNLWMHINFCINKNIKLINIVTEPLVVSEVYNSVFSKGFQNHLAKEPFHYNVKSKYFDSGYIFNKEEVLLDIMQFIKETTL